MCQHSKQDGTDNQFTKSRVRVCNMTTSWTQVPWSKVTNLDVPKLVKKSDQRMSRGSVVFSSLQLVVACALRMSQLNRISAVEVW